MLFEILALAELDPRVCLARLASQGIRPQTKLIRRFRHREKSLSHPTT